MEWTKNVAVGLNLKVLVIELNNKILCKDAINFPFSATVFKFSPIY